MNPRRKLVKKIYDSFDKVMLTEKQEDIGEWLNTTLPAIVDEAIEAGKVEGRIEGQLRERDRAARAAAYRNPQPCPSTRPRHPPA